jgi:hypothetical protein
VLDFRGVGVITTFNVTQSGADALVTTNFGTILLLNVQASTLAASDYLF